MCKCLEREFPLLLWFGYQKGIGDSFSINQKANKLLQSRRPNKCISTQISTGQLKYDCLNDLFGI